MGQFSPLTPASPQDLRLPVSDVRTPRWTGSNPLHSQVASLRNRTLGTNVGHPLLPNTNQTRPRGGMTGLAGNGLRFNSTQPSGGRPVPTASPSPSPVTLRTNPWRFITTFAVIHPLLHYTVFLPPIYLLCSQTNAATWLLAGPSGVALLKTTIPDWIPNGSVYGLRDTRQRVKKRGSRHPQKEQNQPIQSTEEEMKQKKGLLKGLLSNGLDRIEVPSGLNGIKEKGQDYILSKSDNYLPSMTSSSQPPSGPRPTIEDWMETTIYKSISSTIKTGKSLGGLIKTYKGTKQPPSMEEIEAVKNDEIQNGSGKKTWLGGQIANHTQDVRIRTVVDGLTAWLVVKALFPLRLPVSLWVTPRVVKMMLRR
ncbi:unnamed protein product [Sympodiomycopsis kandeliae]